MPENELTDDAWMVSVEQSMHTWCRAWGPMLNHFMELATDRRRSLCGCDGMGSNNGHLNFQGVAAVDFKRTFERPSFFSSLEVAVCRSRKQFSMGSCALYCIRSRFIGWISHGYKEQKAMINSFVMSVYVVLMNCTSRAWRARVVACMKPVFKSRNANPVT